MACTIPWLDYNEDGSIDAYELHQLGGAFGSTGDTTKNVTIAGHVTAYIRPGGEHVLVPVGYWLSDVIPIDGYAKVTILISVPSASASACYYEVFACDTDGYSWLLEKTDSGLASWVKTYDAMNQQIPIKINNGDAVAITAEVAVYLTA